MDVAFIIVLNKFLRRKAELEAELQPFINSCSPEEREICGRLEEIENLIVWLEGKK